MAKYGYICYFVFTKEYTMDPTKWPAFNKLLKEEGKKHGFNLVFYGSPWGVDYHGVAVFESDKLLDDWGPLATGLYSAGTVVSTTTTLVSVIK